MLYKMFFFSRKHLKTEKLSFTEYFPEALLAYFKVSKTLCTCLLLKVYKTFNICLLALLYFSLKEGGFVTPRPDEVHNTCNCKGAYVHKVPL